MNATTIGQLAVATVAGSLPFPEIVGRLMEQGVEYYVVDYRTLQFRFYGVQGGAVEAPLAIEGLPSLQETFDLAGLRAAAPNPSRFGMSAVGRLSGVQHESSNIP